MQPGVTLRDLVHAIPYYAIQQGLLTVEKKGKKNIFNGRILEIEGLPDLPLGQPFDAFSLPVKEVRAGLRALGCLGGALRGGMHHQAERGLREGVPQVQHHAPRRALDDIL